MGPGFKEKYYQRALYLEFKNRGFKFERERKIKVIYNKALLGYHIIDFVVNRKVVVETKSVKELNEVNIGQLSTYLRLSECQVGLLLNFGQSKLEIKRIKI